MKPSDANKPRPELSLVPLAVILVGFGLRLYRLGSQSLWYDETVSAFLAAEPASELIAHTARYSRMVKAGFSQKRRQLKNSLGGGLHRPQAEVAELMQQAGIDPHRRAETLSLAEWAALTEILG